MPSTGLSPKGLDDLVVEGIVLLDRAAGRWCAFIDPGAVRNASECPETFFALWPGGMVALEDSLPQEVDWLWLERFALLVDDVETIKLVSVSPSMMRVVCRVRRVE